MIKNNSESIKICHTAQYGKSINKKAIRVCYPWLFKSSLAGNLISMENTVFVVLNSNYFGATCDDSVSVGCCSLRVVSLGDALLVMSLGCGGNRVDQGCVKPVGGFEQ